MFCEKRPAQAGSLCSHSGNTESREQTITHNMQRATTQPSSLRLGSGLPTWGLVGYWHSPPHTTATSTQMSLITDTLCHINDPGGALINGHGFCFHFGSDQGELAGKHEVCEMRADWGVVDIWINRHKVYRKRVLLFCANTKLLMCLQIIKFHWVTPKNLPLRVFCKVMLSCHEDGDPKLAMTGLMICQSCNGQSLNQMFSTTPGTKGIPAPRWACCISWIDGSSKYQQSLNKLELF